MALFKYSRHSENVSRLKRRYLYRSRQQVLPIRVLPYYKGRKVYRRFGDALLIRVLPYYRGSMVYRLLATRSSHAFYDIIEIERYILFFGDALLMRVLRYYRGSKVYIYPFGASMFSESRDSRYRRGMLYHLLLKTFSE